jgi:hypothetical protein
VLEEAQDHLATAATARIFTAWHEVHVAWVIKRFKVWHHCADGISMK